MTRYSRWWTCTNADCAVKWDHDDELPCWACGSPAERANQPRLTSQNGMILNRL